LILWVASHFLIVLEEEMKSVIVVKIDSVD
jgi:hypothetical protein